MAIQTKDGIQAMPPANYRFCADEHLMMLGKNEDIQKLVKKYNN